MKMKEEKSKVVKKHSKEVETLTLQLVINYVNLNGGRDFLDGSQSNSANPDDIFHRLEARLGLEAKFSHQDATKTLLERIIQSYLGMTSNFFSVKKPYIKKDDGNKIIEPSKTNISKKDMNFSSISRAIDKKEDHHHHSPSFKDRRQSHHISKLRPVTATPNTKRRFTNRPNTASPNFHRRRIKVHAPHSDGKSRSRENWIPDDIRQRMFKRELNVAMVNFEAKETCDMSMKHIARENGNSLERSLSKEKFGIEQRKPCALCGLKFLPVNLVLAVPLKAVFDIRNSWGDKFDPEGSGSIRVNPNLRKAPACYNSTRVCAFCAQLFDQQQETYRPSWEAKEAEKERLRDLEAEAQKKRENDPLSQIEKERDAEVIELNRVVSRLKTQR